MQSQTAWSALRSLRQAKSSLITLSTPSEPSDHGNNSPVYSSSPSYSPVDLSSPGPVRKGFRIRPTMIPFLPYVDKSPDTETTTQSAKSTIHSPDHQWIDVDVIRSWLTACDESHGTHCTAASTSSEDWLGPVWLIDVVSRCLIAARSPTRYFALSYVWGRATIYSDLSLTKGNFAAFQVDNAFHPEHPHVPRLLHDVMSLVAALGERYLWVDRLCIAQDDGPEKRAQLNRMDSIYAGAYATIVAAEGSATSGLIGLPSITGPRNYQLPQGITTDEVRYREILRRSSYDSMFVMSDHEDNDLRDQTPEPTLLKPTRSPTLFTPVDNSGSVLSKHVFENENIQSNQEVLKVLSAKLIKSTWYSRGWTFQEQLFSRRIIVFHDNTVNWECHCRAFHEAQGIIKPSRTLPCDRMALQDSPNFVMSPWPDMYRYARLVSLFNERHLSFPCDVLDAFAGVLSTLSRSFKYGFVSGIPVLFFDAALLWQPYRPMIRRRSGTTIRESRSQQSPPSWSWAGWQGTLHSESWRSAYAYLRDNPDTIDPITKQLDPISWTTVPTTQWYYIDDQERWHDIKALAPPDDEAIHTGIGSWQQNTPSKNDPSKTYFHCPDLGSQTFLYPIPIRDRHIAHVPPVKAQYITTKTWRAYLKTGAFYENSHTSDICLSVELHDPSHVRPSIGVLRLPQVRSEEKDISTCDTYEVIELSRGRVSKKDVERKTFDEWDRLIWNELGDFYEFANIMAISREGEFAYREAVGRVEWQRWQELDKENIEIRIG